ncbi:hypothetical protein DPV78_000138 [Talaromyces pinophilus]|nr:hypothetical protein DPV78_000138 [Talaromyces pinophilus]
MGFSSQDNQSLREQFRMHWQSSTDDNNLTLHGFRRYKTLHLLNLRFLENEIADLDRLIYQAGLSLDLPPSPSDRLGLKNGKRDVEALDIDETITPGLILKVRDLIKQYDEALASFSNIMAMETVSLLDDGKQSSLRTDLTLHEIYKTRMVRVDRGTRSHQDPFQRRIHNWLRRYRYWRLSKRSQHHGEDPNTYAEQHQWSFQDTTLVADVAARIVITVITGSFLVVPLSILSYNTHKEIQLIVISACIVGFAFLVSVMLRTSNAEMMVVSAAYAAVLSVFVSNVPTMY